LDKALNYLSQTGILVREILTINILEQHISPVNKEIQLFNQLGL
jgi:hypothetical protein